MRTLAALLIFALACGTSPSTALPPPAPSPDAGPISATDSKSLLSVVDNMQAEMKARPKSFEVLSALGSLYYENGRYLEAIDTLRLALEKAAPVEAAAQALVARKIAPAKELPPECKRTGTEATFEQLAEAAQKREARESGAALRCYQEGLEAVLAVRARRGDAFYLIGHADSALAEHRAILARSPDYPESLFFVGAILLEQSRGEEKQLEEGRKYWKRLLEVAPDHPRAALVKESLPKLKELFTPKAAQTAPPAGAGAPPMEPRAPSGEPSGGPSPEMLQNVRDAAAQTERTPELEKGLDDLVAQAEKDLDAGNAQGARDKLVRVMPFRPNDARVAAALGSAMSGLGKTEMAERVLGRALSIDPKQPRALLTLARLDAARGDTASAKSRLDLLIGSDPAFAKAHGAAAERAKLK